MKASGTDYDTEWADIAIDTQYHDRFATDAETFRSGATDTVELYYTAKADGDGLAEDAESDTPTAGKVIKRKIYYSEAAFADPDTATWVEFTTLADDITFANAKAALLEYLKARTGGTVPISLKQTWEEVTAAPAFTGLLNETYGSGAEAAYSTRRLNGLYSGDCMTIRRASDSTTQSIGFVGEEIDESAIETFCSGTSCTVQVWRDQSGNGNDATAPSTTNEPTIYTGGQLVKEGGRLSLEFNTSWLLSASEIMNAYPLTAFSIVKFTSVSGGRWYLDQSGTYGPGFKNSSSGDGLRVFYNYGSYGFLDTTTSVLNKQILSTASLVSSNQTLYVDGVSVATESTAFSGSGLSGVDFAIGTDTSNTTSRAFTGEIQEIVIYTSDKSSDRTSIEGNISVYFQSAKLLDEQYGSGAEAAYSTRQLRRDQTDCMVIRRASDSTTTTIGFDTEGNIDETAIETFCTGTTCTVSSWLDQSGNGNDATQATAANQPTIYTGGQLVKEGGRLSLEFNTSWLLSASEIMNAYPLTAFSIVKFTSVSGGRWYLDQSGTYGPGFKNSSSGDGLRVFYNYGSYGFLDTTTSVLNKQILSTASLVSSNQTLYVDGVSVATESTAFSGSGLSGVDFAIGTDTSNTTSRAFTGEIQEIVIYTSDKSSDRTSIEGNISVYFQSAKLLDEQYGSGAEAAYSTRQLRRDQTDCMVIRRASDSTTTTIGFDTEGNIDETAIETFCTGTTCTVSSWLDQSGNGNDATQATAANQPTIYTGGQLVKESGRVAVEFDGSNDTMETADFSSLIGAPNFFSACISFDDTADQYFIDSDSPGRSATGIISGNYSMRGLNGGAASTGKHLMSVSQLSSGAALFVDSSQVLTNGSSTLMTHTNILISDNALRFDGKFQELTLWSADKSSDRTSIEENVGDYFTQNTPLLDTYSGAAAAYSLRKLSSTYTGDAVEVYNGSSYADIGFNVFGELDTVALASHCGSNDGFVSKWYDQAGSNDATQTTTANMPKIYDGTTGVELKNARPIMINTNGNAHLVSSLQINGGTHVFHVQGITTTYPLCISLGGGFAYYMYGNALSTIGASDWYVDGQLGTDRGIGSRQNLYTYAGTNNFIASASISTTSTNPVYLGTSVSNYGMLNMQEMIIYPSDQSANRTNIEDNINTFYSIY